MDWTQPHTVEYTAVSVELGWQDGASLDLLAVESATNDEDSGSAAIVLGEQIGEQWVRIYATATFSSGVEKVALWTGLSSLPSVAWDGALGTWSCELSGPLSCCDDVLLPIGWWTDGENPAQVAAALMARSTPAPVECAEGAPPLSQAIVAEQGETCGSMARKLVKACGWRIRVSGDGRIHVEPKPGLHRDVLDESANDVLMPLVDESIDMAGIPNVFRATSGDAVSVARDDDWDSGFSTVSRRREIWAEERDVPLNTGESLDAYAARRLREMQDVSRRISYTREWVDLDVGDLVRINLPSIGIDADYRIVSQSYHCETALTVDEEAVLA